MNGYKIKKKKVLKEKIVEVVIWLNTLIFAGITRHKTACAQIFRNHPHNIMNASDLTSHCKQYTFVQAKIHQKLLIHIRSPPRPRPRPRPPPCSRLALI